MAFAIAARVMGLRDLGPAISPFNAFLIINGIETLPLRMQRHCENTMAVAEYLERHPAVAWVNYAGLPGNPYNANQKKIVSEEFEKKEEIFMKIMKEAGDLSFQANQLAKDANAKSKK